MKKLNEYEKLHTTFDSRNVDNIAAMLGNIGDDVVGV